MDTSALSSSAGGGGAGASSSSSSSALAQSSSSTARPAPTRAPPRVATPAPSADGPIRFRSNFRNTIYDVMRGRGWVETDSEFDWHFQWSERDWVYADIDSMHFDPWQRVNHFRNGRELCRKDLLAKNIKRCRRQLEKERLFEQAARYDFTPTTFTLPGDYALFVEEFKKPAHAGCAWIMKPIGKSQGAGIFLFNKLAQVSQWKADSRWKPETPGVEAYVVQKYIANPYTLGGKKFDMRIYALVTSFAPLTVYVYRSGFCRFSASRYSTEKADLVNNFVHLTNVAIQKTADNYNADTGGKWELRRLKSYLSSKHGAEATDRSFTAMQDIILLSLQAVAKSMMADRHCFELYGYDILIDEALKPWLIEVNASPSLTANTREDYDLKYKLLNDVLDIVDMEGRLPHGGGGADGTDPLHRVGGFDLVWRDGPVPITLAPGMGSPVIGGGGGGGGGAGSGAGTGGGGGGSSGSGLGGPSVYGTLLGADFDKRLNVFPKPAPAQASGTSGPGGGGGNGSSSTGGAATGTAAGSSSSSGAAANAGGREESGGGTGGVASPISSGFRLSSTTTGAGGLAAAVAAAAAGARAGGASADGGSRIGAAAAAAIKARTSAASGGAGSGPGTGAPSSSGLARTSSGSGVGVAAFMARMSASATEGSSAGGGGGATAAASAAGGALPRKAASFLARSRSDGAGSMDGVGLGGAALGSAAPSTVPSRPGTASGGGGRGAGGAGSSSLRPGSSGPGSGGMRR
jgi:tubulin polyglutamylase TTLL9